MHWSAVVLLGLLPMLAPGCLEGTVAAIDGQGCAGEPRQSVLARQYALLLPSEAPSGLAPKARIEVEGYEGGRLQATATWSTRAGSAQVVFDGPNGLETHTDRTWTWFGEVEEALYVLELEGAPAAESVTVVLTLTALC